MTDCKTQFAKQKENYKQQDIKRKHSYTDTLSLSFTPPPCISAQKCYQQNDLYT